MIKHNKPFMTGIILFSISIVLVIPFPDNHPFVLNEAFSIPLKTVEGYSIKGYISLILLLTGIIFLVNSLEKYKLAAFLGLLFIANFSPQWLVASYQKTVANGIDAVSYDRGDSQCSFEKKNEETLHAICRFPMKNNSGEDVRFSLELMEYNLEDYESRKHPLNFNLNGPYSVELKGKEQKVVELETDINISDLQSDFEGGEFSLINIRISANGESRQL